MTYIIFFFIISQRNSHKGESGKIGVIGGSFEYTGAPYYSAMTSLKVVSFLDFSKVAFLYFTIFLHFSKREPILRTYFVLKELGMQLRLIHQN